MSVTAEKTTHVQRQRVEEIEAKTGGQRLYTYPVQGKTIVGQFRRYVTREDSSCIEHALYDFLMMVCGFIAEYGLIPPDGGFRSKWAEPAALIEELANGGGGTRRGHVERVYCDGMTDVEVLAAIDGLADAHRAAGEQGRSDREFNRDISIAINLLDPHRFMVVPPGWRLVAAEDAPPQPEQPPGSLAERLAELAQANGQNLIAPAAVYADGQVRLLPGRPKETVDA